MYIIHRLLGITYTDSQYEFHILDNAMYQVPYSASMGILCEYTVLNSYIRIVCVFTPLLVIKL